MATNSVEPLDVDREQEIKLKRMESGWLGRVFGSPSNAPANIAGIVAVGLMIFGAVHSFLQPDAALSHWNIIAPIITLILGYMFGKKESRGR